jgi:hypothetical protein
VEPEIIESFIAMVSKLLPSSFNSLIHANKATVRTDDTPTVRNALRADRGDREEWITAINKEIKLLFQQGTLEPVDRRDFSKRSRVIRMVMQLKIKRHQDGRIEKYKARGCADGSQLSNELFDSFSPTISSPTLFLILQLAIIDKMHMISIDVVGAYLYQVYPDSSLLIYMILNSDVARACGLDPNQLHRVRKYLYGLPDAGKAFYESYSNVLVSHGYIKTDSDPCLFTKISNDRSRRTYVCIHVDDTFVASTHSDELIHIQDVLKSKFEITVNDNIESYLGIQLSTMSDGSVVLTQPKLIESLLSDYGSRLPVKIPMSPMRHRDPICEDKSGSYDKQQYQRLLGGLMYLVKSRPDIAAALSYAATKSVSPSERDFDDLLYMLAYLKGTRELGLVLMSNNASSSLVMRCYVDASYLSHSDSKSHHGWTISLGEFGCFLVKSQKQSIVATSSTHAEMHALFKLSVEIVYFIELMVELGRPLSLPVVIFEDNQPVLDLVKETRGVTKRSRHFLMNIAYVRHLISTKYIDVIKVPTESNTADILTKAITGQDWEYKRQQTLGMIPGELLAVPITKRVRRVITYILSLAIS